MLYELNRNRCTNHSEIANTLHAWKKAFLEDSRNCFPGNGKVTEYETEMTRLKRELELVKEERDILKKAVGIFSETRR